MAAGNTNIKIDNTIKPYDPHIADSLVGTQTSTGEGDKPADNPDQGGSGGSKVTIPAESNNLYAEIGGNKQEYKPNSGVDENGNPLKGGGYNTGSGAEAAVGTQYSWDKTGASKAQLTYSSDVLSAKQNLLNNRQTIENNAVNYQTQADMMKYQNNQNAEKVGWTGGYVLDQNRQMDYLKASIQAQMYGAMELQKYGYESSLAAARLSYDLNMQEYAHQYYQEAVTAALSEAQLTGTYFSAETKDMMAQYATASQKLKENPDDEIATNVQKQIESWFQENGISKEGVKTLEAWQADQSNELSWSNELWTRYNAVLNATNASDVTQGGSTFIWLDENGKEQWDGTNIKTGNFDTISMDDLVSYLQYQNANGQTVLNSGAVDQLYSYLNSNLVGQIKSGFQNWCVSKGYVTKDENGNYKSQDIKESTFLQYLKESGITQKLLSKYSDGFKNSELLTNKLNSFEFTFEMPDGKTITYSAAKLLETEYTPTDKNEQQDVDKDKMMVYTTENGWEQKVIGTNVSLSYDYLKGEQLNPTIQTEKIDQSKVDDDFDYTIGRKNYDLDVDWILDNSTGAQNTYWLYMYYNYNPNKLQGKQFDSIAIQAWNNDQAYLKAAYPNAKDGDLGISYVDGDRKLWIYYNGKWGYVQRNTGGTRLFEDVDTYMSGSKPGRW